MKKKAPTIKVIKKRKGSLVKAQLIDFYFIMAFSKSG